MHGSRRRPLTPAVLKRTLLGYLDARAETRACAAVTCTCKLCVRCAATSGRTNAAPARTADCNAD